MCKLEVEIPHIKENNDLYAVPVKRRQDSEEERRDENLPPGWEKHEDNDGPYYWHIKSGTIQREVPEKKYETVTRSSSALDLEERKRKEELALK